MAGKRSVDHQADDAAGPRSGLSRAGQVALVTGGSAGLGLAIARALGRAGSAVTVASRSAARLLGRWATPHEIAGAALMFTDPQSSYLTGVVLPVDGGWTAH